MLTPGEPDKAALRRIVGDLHVTATDESVRYLVCRKLKKAKQRDGLYPSQGTLDNWCDAAVEIHRENGVLFAKVMTGDLS